MKYRVYSTTTIAITVCSIVISLFALCLQPVYADNGEIASGVYDSVPWKITNSKQLQIGIEGQMTSFDYNAYRWSGSYPWSEYKKKIHSVCFLGKVKGNGSFQGLFYKYDTGVIDTIDVSNFDTSQITNMDGMFSKCGAEIIGIDTLDTSNAISMKGMFKDYSYDENLNLSNFNTSKVTNMNGMFDGYCADSLNIQNFDTKEVTDMSYMFNDSLNLKQIYGLEGFDTKNVVTMERMFNCCEAIKELDLRSFNTNNVVNMEKMFTGCASLKIVALGPETKLQSTPPRTNWNRTADLDGMPANGPIVQDLFDYDSAFPGWYRSMTDVAKPGKVKIKNVKVYRVNKGYTQIVLSIKVNKKKYISLFDVEFKEKNGDWWGMFAPKKYWKNGKLYLYGKLKKGKKYTIKVSAVREMDDTWYYGAWSNKKTITGK